MRRLPPFLVEFPDDKDPNQPDVRRIGKQLVENYALLKMSHFGTLGWLVFGAKTVKMFRDIGRGMPVNNQQEE